jgi:hypothetical protein
MRIQAIQSIAEKNFHTILILIVVGENIVNFIICEGSLSIGMAVGWQLVGTSKCGVLGANQDSNQTFFRQVTAGLHTSNL